MNPLIYLVAALAIFAAGFGGGHRVGTNAQKVADQAQFDQINAQTATNKAIAEAKYRNAQAVIIQMAADRAIASNQREKERQSNVATINDLRTRYASNGLRFSTAKTSGSGGGGSGAAVNSADPTGDTGPAEVQLPDRIGKRLRELAYSADALVVDYKTLYDWAHDPNLCK